MYIKITDQVINPEQVINEAKTRNSGCIVSYVGLINDTSQGKSGRCIEYRDLDGQVKARLTRLGEEIMQKYPVNSLAICHRVGKLKVNDVNIVFAFACGHRQEGFAACSYAIDRFEEILSAGKSTTC